jgi:glycosyltransferase involved in cell wall biosynthesis
MKLGEWLSSLFFVKTKNKKLKLRFREQYMNKVLIITYAFPPSNDVAIHRVLRFSKWLPQYGWEPVVLTPKYTLTQRVDNDNLYFVDKYVKRVYHSAGFFESMISHLADKKNRNPFARFVRGYFLNELTPDKSIIWKAGAVKKGLDIIWKEKIDVIWATLGPPTTGLIGAELKRRTNTPLLIDYRDPWTLNPYNKYSGKRLRANRIHEIEMLKEADAVITTSEPIKKIIVENGFFHESRTSVVTNGMDEELQWMNDNNNELLLDRSKFNITYAGAFYGDRQPYTFIDGLKSFISEHPDYIHKVRFNIIGNQDPSQRIQSYCRSAGLGGIVNESGLIPYRKSMQYLKQSDLLLLVNGTHSSSKVFIPGKLFDYLVTLKPILFVGEGQPSRIVSELAAGESVRHSQVEIANILKDMIINKPEYKYDKDKIMKYAAKEITKFFSELLNSLK